MEKILADFGIQPILLLAQVVNFLVLLFILKKLLYQPILKVLDERKKKIEQSLIDAQSIELKLVQTEEDREKKLAKASEEAKQILDEATKSANLVIEEAHLKASKDMEEILQKGQESINAERSKMHQEIREELADLIEVSLEKVAGKILTTKDQKELVQKTIKQL
ncbi:MAG: ATP synthase subunit b [uncultured bacterium]|uniref:ATP synthase subunit b n=4 Tax=Candidatus Daviesiibacteriota TaxID=1752718 RepID=A0A0G0HEH3_9BACT|nr:MAG: ATP synthase subunit b [uncultured bacterium]KKQ10519.1 MAG: ATP synthase subunit b [Candidatus Daviesbacteria bacterium GW2011_GWB1_36_5]KKQ14943.1 MAG: ATP synthase subunit b [Candidatus Daviesbacteria bacterium GW2011_GWA1_36_8]OGE17220.1 MAG: ATP synthase F0 subunit B [Candidatus Daviesbacteria bacterium RIFCSPHIGHO2_01_FULL_36_37]OGE36000.1 MAG: ATP synthase F0 subunit B [Candidatus Daviesbacteria bacterium RIFCSPHIGHO2_12_FULL_37_16]